jgi:alpha-ribazole phosphatase
MNTLPCLIRHAPPLVPDALASSEAAQAKLWCYGRSDWPASLAHTRAAASRWLQAHTLPDRPLTIRCSPLSRCELLALEIKALGVNFVLKKDNRLVEIDFGAWEGQLWRDVPHEEVDAWAADFYNYRLGGTGDSVRGWLSQVLAALQDSGWAKADVDVDAARPSQADDVWITHAGVIRAVQWWQAAGCPSTAPPELTHQAWPMTAPAYGHWMGVGAFA